MSALRPEVSIHTLNKAGGEYLPGYLGIEMLALDERRLNSRMPVKKLHAAPNEFLPPRASSRWPTPPAATRPSPTCPRARTPSPPSSSKSNPPGTVRGRDRMQRDRPSTSDAPPGCGRPSPTRPADG